MQKQSQKKIVPGKFPPMPKDFIFIKGKCYVSFDKYNKLKNARSN